MQSCVGLPLQEGEQEQQDLAGPDGLQAALQEDGLQEEVLPLFPQGGHEVSCQGLSGDSY